MCRAFFYAWCAFQVYVYAPWDYARMPPEFWRPPYVLWMCSAPTPQLALVVCQVLWVALAFCTVGLFTRLTTAVAALLLTYAFGVTNGYGAVGFHHSPLVLIAWVLALSRCGDAFSLDALRTATVPDSPAYRWPIRVCRVVLVVMMVSAGYHKTVGGWWADPALSIEYFIRAKAYVQAEKQGLIPSVALLALLSHRGLLMLMGWGTVTLELFSPLALPDRWPRLRAVFIGGLFGMQLTLAALATLASFPWLAAYVFWLPSLEHREPPAS